jgi:uncharacterized protein YsxB (DUF464 family)
MISVVVSGVLREVTLDILPGAGQITLCMSGHSGFDSKGSDIVCAGVSTLVQTAAKFLSVRKIRFEMGRREGFLDLRVSLDGLSEEKIICVVHAFDMALGGIEMIAGSYPDNVEIRIVK